MRRYPRGMRAIRRLPALELVDRELVRQAKFEFHVERIGELVFCKR